MHRMFGTALRLIRLFDFLAGQSAWHVFQGPTGWLWIVLPGVDAQSPTSAAPVQMLFGYIFGVAACLTSSSESVSSL